MGLVNEQGKQIFPRLRLTGNDTIAVNVAEVLANVERTHFFI
jgi:hypothetical protein